MDQEEIDRALDACYEAVVAPAAWQQALDGVCRAVNAAAIMFYPKNLNADTAPVPCSQAYEDFLPDFIAGGWYDNHYRSERGWPILRQHDTCVVIEHQLATDEERKWLPHYNELYLPKGYPGFAAIGFNIGDEQWAMCLLRDHSQGFFTPDDAQRMTPLAGHFRRMVRLSERFETTCISTSLAALDEQGRPAAVLGKDGRICAMNTACERLLANSADALVVRNGRFSALAPASNHALQYLIQATTTAGHDNRRAAMAKAVAIARYGRWPVLAEALPLAALGLDHTLHAQTILTFSDPERKRRSQAARYRAAFGLTQSEAGFAALLAGGHSIDEAADALSITRETARNRLKTIFTKTDTHRQGELVSLLARLS